MCLPLQDGQTPRALHENATTNVCVHRVQPARVNLKQSSPHVRYPRNSCSP